MLLVPLATLFAAGAASDRDTRMVWWTPYSNE
jgi:hypothetical protein